MKENENAMTLLSSRGLGYAARLAPWFAASAIGILAPSTAEAHFKLTAPPSWLSQDSVGGPQKNGPCAAVPNTGLGDSTGTPTKVVTVLQSGQMVPVSVAVTVGHPGWFRIALVEGPSSSQTLSTLADPQAQAGTNCTPAILKNPVWSPTQPILADGLPAGSTATTQQTGNQTFQVTIPTTATCTSTKPCTLQVIMVMTDHPSNDCYYHHCADISTGSDADAGSDSADASVAKDASQGLPDANGAGGNSNSGGSSGQGGGSATGGVMGSGGSAGTGGAIGGGGAGAGGAKGSGGSTNVGGSTGNGGSANSGGETGKGGSIGMGGSPGKDSTGAGGANSSGGGAGRSDSGKSASGCSFGNASRGGASWGTSAALLGALWALRGRRRRRGRR